MMTLIAGQPNAAATVDQCAALWSTRKFVRPEAVQSKPMVAPSAKRGPQNRK
jgi:hypothetical protein